MESVGFGASVVVGAVLAKNFGSTLGSAERQIRTLGESARKAKVGKEITGDIVRLRGSLAALRREQVAGSRSSAELEREIGDVGAALRKAGERAKQHGISIGDAAREHRRFSDELERSEERVGRLQRRKEAWDETKTALGVVAGAAYGVGRLIGSAMEVEKRQVMLRTVINSDDGDTEAAARRAREHAAEFARNTLATETEVLDIQYNLHSAGLGEAAATAGAEVAHKVAVATRGNAEQVASVIGTVYNNFGDAIAGSNPAEKLARVGDVLTRTQQKFAIEDFGQLSEGMDEVAASATSADLSLEQAAVAIGMLNTAGTKGSSAGTAMNQVLARLDTAAKKQGVSLVRSTEDGALDLAASLEAIEGTLTGGTDDRMGRLRELFGDEGFKGVMPILENLDGFRMALDAAGASAGAFQDAYDTVTESDDAKWEMAKQNIQQAGTAFGASLLPMIGPLSDGLSTVAGWISSLTEKFPWLGRAVAVAGAAFATFVLAGKARKYFSTFEQLKPVGRAIGRARKALARMGRQLTLTNLKAKAFAVGGALRRFGTGVMDTARTARQALVRFGRQLTLTNLKMKALAVGGAVRKFGSALVGLASGGIKAAVAGLRALGTAVAANPIGLVITAVVLAAALIWKYWEPIKAFFGRLFAPLVEFARPVFAWISAKVSAVAGWIYARLRPVAAFYGRVFGAIVEFLRPVFAWIGNKIAVIGGWVRKALAVVGPAFAVLLGPIGLLVGAAVLLYRNWEPIQVFFGRLWEGIAAGASAAFGFLGRVWKGVESAFSGLRSVVQGAVGAVVAWLENFSLADIGKNLLGTLGDGILTAKDAVVEKVGAVFGAVRNLLPFSDAREGPFAQLTASGAAILGTVGEGVRRAGSGPLRRPLQSALGAAVVGLGVPAASGGPALPAGSPPAPHAGAAPAKQIVVSPGAVSPGAIVLHFHGPTDDPAWVAQEVERQLTDLFRRAANEARLLETDDA